MIILVDDEDRENEGDLTMVAEKITPEAINFMSRYGRGLDLPGPGSSHCGKTGPQTDGSGQPITL